MFILWLRTPFDYENISGFLAALSTLNDLQHLEFEFLK